MEDQYWVVGDEHGAPRSEYGVMGSSAACSTALACQPLPEGDVAGPAPLTTARAALVMLHGSSTRLAAVADPDTGQRGIHPAGVAGLWWQDAMSRAADVLQAPSDPGREQEMLLELLESSRVLSNTTFDDGETDGICRMGVEGLHFGSAYGGAKHVLGVDDRDLDRLTTKPDYVRLDPDPPTPVEDVPGRALSPSEPADRSVVGSSAPRSGGTGVGAPPRPAPVAAYQQSRVPSPERTPRR